MARTNIAVEERLADALSDEAAKQNKTLYALANEFLEIVLKVSREGGSSRDVYPSWRFVRILKDVDSIPIPGNLLEKMVKGLFRLDRESLTKAWFEEGERVGTYLQMFAPRIEELAAVVEEMQTFLPVKRIQVERVEDEGGRSHYLLKAVGAGLSEESTACSVQFVLGIFAAYSLRPLESHVSQGMVEVRAVQEAARQP